MAGRFFRVGIRQREAPNGEVFPTTYRVGAALSNVIGRTAFRVRYVGLENVPETGGGILAPNHSSFLDPLLVACRVPRPMVFIAHKMFFDREPLGTWMRKAGGFPVATGGDSTASIREVLRALKGGRLLGMFPEGTRSWDGQLLPPMPGVGLLVSATDVPVIPVHVDGAYGAWPRHRRFPRPRRITIRFGPPVALADLRARASADRAHRRDHQQAIAAAVMDAIAALDPKRVTGS
jgi:1-acyl-sn-glycerol-3-phosphate acyltransferase